VNEIQLIEIEQRVKRVEGKKWGIDIPYEYCDKCGGDYYEVVAEDLFLAPVIAEVKSKDDAEFIAHAREDVPALAAEVRRLRLALTEILEIVDYREYDEEDTLQQIGSIVERALAE